uniref:RING-type domain-containing protein n=1 Tax=Salarias fasciatus TaxID=181472 RepID=A0A672GNH1_SALFA
PGHHIRDCPSQNNNPETGQRMKKTTGIPRSFLLEVDDPTMRGVMLTTLSKLDDHEAYAEDPTPEELLCGMCEETLCDAVLIPCCANSYCDQCVCDALLDSDDHVCPTCKQPHVSPDALTANHALRQIVLQVWKKIKSLAPIPTVP